MIFGIITMTNNFIIDAAWTLTIAFALSLIYEFYRATVKANVSKHDTMRMFFIQGIPFYGIAAVVIYFLFSGFEWAAWVGLIYSAILILVSVFYYNPVIMMERKPGLIDWFEDLVYTGLLFVAATMLLYSLAGK
jgi:phosphatidylserine synthase